MRTNEASDPVSFAKVKDVPQGILSRDAATLDGKDSADFAGAAHSHSGADITSGTVAADRVQDGSGSGLDADQLDGKNSSEFATKASEGWHETFTYSPFVNMGAPFNTVAYYKDPLRVVHLKGVVFWNAPGGSVGPSGCDGQQYTTFTTLPTGYRPAAREVHPSLKNNTPTRIDIYSDGRVAFCDSRNVFHGDWFSLDGISFRATN